MSTGQPACAVVGPFPPPVTGAAKNTQNVFDALCASGVRASRHNTAVAGATEIKGAKYHLRRVARNSAVFLSLAIRGARERSATLYIVPDAGLGMYYTLAHTLLAKALYGKIVFHHRSYFYINRNDRVMHLLTTIAARKALHVFLSRGMADDFQRRYGAVRHLAASNACFVSAALASAPVPVAEHVPLRIGHLSNLRRNKGFLLVADVFERVIALGTHAELHLAGPVTDAEAKQRLEALQQTHGSKVRYHGPVFGSDKQAFYEGIDVFLFPTLHPQEAQPNVIYEAHAVGVPVLATPRACIPDMLDGTNGAVSATDEAFVPFAVGWLVEFSASACRHTLHKDTIRQQLRQVCEQSKAQYRRLLSELGAPDKTTSVPWLA